MKSSRTPFTRQQQQILYKILQDLPQNEKTQYKKITQKFNELCQQKIGNIKLKSYRAISIKIKSMFQIKNHYWDQKLDQNMLDQVAKGKKWRQIAKQYQFKKHNIDAEKIKRKFECGLRNKFKTIYRQTYKKQKKSPHISDPTFKCILQQSKINEMYDSRVISFIERECLIGNISVFKTSMEDSADRRETRSTKIKSKILSLVNHVFPLTILVSSIIRIHNHKKKQSTKSIQFCLSNQNDAQGLQKLSQYGPTSPGSFINIDLQIEQLSQDQRINPCMSKQIIFDSSIEYNVKTTLSLNMLIQFNKVQTFYS